jgi:hypothetical protein
MVVLRFNTPGITNSDRDSRLTTHSQKKISKGCWMTLISHEIEISKGHTVSATSEDARRETRVTETLFTVSSPKIQGTC